MFAFKQQESPWIETATGERFYILDPAPYMIHIEDIAAALSKQCRFTGHSNKFYSIAEHSVYVSRLVPDDLRFAALLHDASEAYLTDVASPVKPLLTNYHSLEYKIMVAIYQRFNIKTELLENPFIKDADKAQLKEEARELMPSKGMGWRDQYPTNLAGGFVPAGLFPEMAEQFFLNEFEGVSQ